MEQPKAKPYIRELILFRTRQVTPVLFAAWERFSPDDFVRVLKLVSIVSFRYLVSGRNPNALELVYHLAAKAILDGNATRPRAVFTRLRPRLCGRQDVREQLRSVFYQRQGAQEAPQVHPLPIGGKRRRHRTRSGGGSCIDRAHSPADSVGRLDRGILRSGVGSSGRSDRERDAARVGCQPRYRKRPVLGETLRIRTECLCADPGKSPRLRPRNGPLCSWRGANSISPNAPCRCGARISPDGHACLEVQQT